MKKKFQRHQLSLVRNAEANPQRALRAEHFAEYITVLVPAVMARISTSLQQENRMTNYYIDKRVFVDREPKCLVKNCNNEPRYWDQRHGMYIFGCEEHKNSIWLADWKGEILPGSIQKEEPKKKKPYTKPVLKEYGNLTDKTGVRSHSHKMQRHPHNPHI